MSTTQLIRALAAYYVLVLLFCFGAKDAVAGHDSGAIPGIVGEDAMRNWKNSGIPVGDADLAREVGEIFAELTDTMTVVLARQLKVAWVDRTAESAREVWSERLNWALEELGRDALLPDELHEQVSDRQPVQPDRPEYESFVERRAAVSADLVVSQWLSALRHHFDESAGASLDLRTMLPNGQLSEPLEGTFEKLGLERDDALATMSQFREELFANGKGCVRLTFADLYLVQGETQSGAREPGALAITPVENSSTARS